MLFNAALPDVCPVRQRKNHEPIYRIWPQSTNVTDRQTTTDRPVAIPTHWLTSHESAKTTAVHWSAQHNLYFCFDSFYISWKKKWLILFVTVSISSIYRRTKHTTSCVTCYCWLCTSVLKALDLRNVAAAAACDWSLQHVHCTTVHYCSHHTRLLYLYSETLMYDSSEFDVGLTDLLACLPLPRNGTFRLKLAHQLFILDLCLLSTHLVIFARVHLRHEMYHL